MRDLVAGWNGGKTGPTCPNVEGPGCGPVFYTPVGYGKETVAIAVDEHSQENADEIAHLIASAPELYGALDEFLKQHERLMNGESYSWTSVIDKGKKAQAKARGEQQ